MLRTKYRCILSLNISVDVAKCVESFHKFIKYIHFLSATKNDLSPLNNLFMARIEHIIMSSYAKKKLQLCSVTQYQCRRRQMGEKFHKFTQYTHFLFVTKYFLSRMNNLFMVRFQLISMSSYAKNKLEMCSVTQHQCKRRQMCENIHKFTQYSPFLYVAKNDLSRLNNLFMARFQFIRKCYYVKNKLQLCSVTQHQCRHRQMCEQFHKFTQYTHFCLLLKMIFLDWAINSCQGFNSLGCPLMLRTNYRCAQLLNIIVDVAKCVENFRKFTQYTHFLSVAKNDLSWLNNLFMAWFQFIRKSYYAKNKLKMCSVTQHQCRHRQMCEQFHKLTQYTHFCLLLKMTFLDWTIYLWQGFNS